MFRSPACYFFNFWFLKFFLLNLFVCLIIYIFLHLFIHLQLGYAVSWIFGFCLRSQIGTNLVKFSCLIINPSEFSIVFWKHEFEYQPTLECSHLQDLLRPTDIWANKLWNQEFNQINWGLMVQSPYLNLFQV